MKLVKIYFTMYVHVKAHFFWFYLRKYIPITIAMQTDKVTMFGKIASLCRLFRASQVSSLYLKEYFMFCFICLSYTVIVIWEWIYRCNLEVFLTQKFFCMNCETYLALECAPKPPWPTGFEKSKIHQPNPEELQFKGSKIEAFLLDFEGNWSKSIF